MFSVVLLVLLVQREDEVNCHYSENGFRLIEFKNQSERDQINCPSFCILSNGKEMNARLPVTDANGNLYSF